MKAFNAMSFGQRFDIFLPHNSNDSVFHVNLFSLIQRFPMLWSWLIGCDLPENVIVAIEHEANVYGSHIEKPTSNDVNVNSRQMRQSFQSNDDKIEQQVRRQAQLLAQQHTQKLEQQYTLQLQNYSQAMQDQFGNKMNDMKNFYESKIRAMEEHIAKQNESSFNDFSFQSQYNYQNALKDWNGAGIFDAKID